MKSDDSHLTFFISRHHHHYFKNYLVLTFIAVSTVEDAACIQTWNMDMEIEDTKNPSPIVKRQNEDDSSEQLPKKSKRENMEKSNALQNEMVSGESVATFLPPCGPGVIQSSIKVKAASAVETVSQIPPHGPPRQSQSVVVTMLQHSTHRHATHASPQNPCTHESIKMSQNSQTMEASTTGVEFVNTTISWTSDAWLRKFLLVVGATYTYGLLASTKSQQHSFVQSDHLIVPSYGTRSASRANMTLREFLLHEDGIHLGMAPAFFGYYGYFGALAAWDDELSNSSFPILKRNIKSVAGASAGAMAAILIASGVPPRTAAEFCSTITLGDFADPPGLLTVFRGDKFESIMQDFMAAQNPDSSLQLQDSIIPVSVSGFDLLTMEGKLLTRGSMARAARASACFPFLFQPVGWVDKDQNYLFTDGGITDTSGLNGLGAFRDSGTRKRVVNLVVGDFQFGSVPGPSLMPNGVDASEVVSISIRGLPQCGPWAMENGPLAVDGAHLAMKAALDLPMFSGIEEGHYVLHIDAASYVSRREK